ncbi:hypothetical protein BDA96_04G075100 [Sorghum bicolor]|uniref:Uncharacterized protein n=2 Tax=Sorghum bicolor TaxID=4558 RepID=A0A921R3N4_SORBI|nr:hypothetical protein BDA96_04G075100 [Sorghum bicolor]KXG29642.1 hypothetical protein SORBI_3004G069300 [Sorghum bicolor]
MQTKLLSRLPNFYPVRAMFWTSWFKWCWKNLSLACYGNHILYSKFLEPLIDLE